MDDEETGFGEILEFFHVAALSFLRIAGYIYVIVLMRDRR